MLYKNIYAPLLWLLTVSLLTACSLEPADYPTPSEPKADSDRLIVLCEGLWGMDNSSLSLIDNGVLTNRWFQQQNPGRHLGDTGNDILQVNDTLIAISVNWSNIVQYIHPDGTAIAATENIPNNRRLATDHNGYLYVTSYADNGYVAKVDLRTKQVVDTCHVGREPEGIAYYDGRLYVANTGGYATQTKDHDYEQTVSVVDAQTMRELRRIDTGYKNLYGKPAQWGQYLCINAAGDYYNQPPQCIILNMANDEFRTFSFPATYCCAYQGTFYIIGSAYSYITEAYAFSAHTISLPSMEAEGRTGSVRRCHSDDPTDAVALRHLYLALHRTPLRQRCPSLRHQRLRLRVRTRRQAAKQIPAKRSESLGISGVAKSRHRGRKKKCQAEDFEV